MSVGVSVRVAARHAEERQQACAAHPRDQGRVAQPRGSAPGRGDDDALPDLVTTGKYSHSDQMRDVVGYL